MRDIKTSARKLAIPFAAVSLISAALLAAPTAAHAGTDTFGLLTDTHVRSQGDGGGLTTNADTVNAIRWANSLSNLKAIVVAGDLTDRGTPRDVSKFQQLWDAQGVSVPRIVVMGNHDSNNGGSWGSSPDVCTRAFQRLTGGKFTTYQQFENANIMTIGGKYTWYQDRVFTDGMIREINNRLRETARAGKWSIVICHYPYSNNYPNRRKLMGVLRSYPNVIYVSGHRHFYAASQWCQSVKPSYDRTPYAREGIIQSKTYNMISIGLDSVSRSSSYLNSPNQSIASALSVDSNKVAYLHRQNIYGGNGGDWTITPTTGSITIQNAAKAKGNSRPVFTYCVTFSDGKVHNGVQSGGTFTLAAGESKKFESVAGVLMRVYCTNAPSGYAHCRGVVKEITNTSQTVKMVHKRTK